MCPDGPINEKLDKRWGLWIACQTFGASEALYSFFCKKFYIHASLRLAQRWRPQWAADMLSQPLSSAACTPVSAIETCEKKLGAHPSVQDVSKDIIGNQQAKPSA
mmetsp:Transcript_82382/g.207284  ORF Transcript_82382/g.207284 Transcript_82382/m.207284 type:complete len:105 (-) Transcript_82382:1149-1463(-)